MVKLSVVVAFFCFLVGCQTIPDDAPEVFSSANAEIEKAEDADADEHAPKSVALAKADLDEANRLWYKSHEDDADRNALRDQAIAKAESAKARAEKVNLLDEEVALWDDNIDEYAGDDSTTAQLEDKIAVLESELAEKEGGLASRSSIYQGQTPVAYFDFDSTKLSSSFKQSIASLAEVLQANSNKKVTLMGFADANGKKDYNYKLAQLRAVEVSSALEERGVAPERIQIVVKGEASDRPLKGKGANQLLRRVDSIISDIQ